MVAGELGSHARSAMVLNRLRPAVCFSQPMGVLTGLLAYLGVLAALITTAAVGASLILAEGNSPRRQNAKAVPRTHSASDSVQKKESSRPSQSSGASSAPVVAMTEHAPDAASRSRAAPSMFGISRLFPSRPQRATQRWLPYDIDPGHIFREIATIPRAARSIRGPSWICSRS
jgi:hypothetical protein